MPIPKAAIRISTMFACINDFLSNAALSFDIMLSKERNSANRRITRASANPDNTISALI